MDFHARKPYLSSKVHLRIILGNDERKIQTHEKKLAGDVSGMIQLPKAGAGIFFIGIGGVSMSALAVIAKEKGYRSGGSDRTASETTRRLQTRGIEVFIGHDASHLAGYDAVVYNAAISEENPELRAAKEQGMTVIYRADFMRR